MMKPVGYLVKHPSHLEGERGMFYDYVLASNGLVQHGFVLDLMRMVID